MSHHGFAHLQPDADVHGCGALDHKLPVQVGDKVEHGLG